MCGGDDDGGVEDGGRLRKVEEVETSFAEQRVVDARVRGGASSPTAVRPAEKKECSPVSQPARFKATYSEIADEWVRKGSPITAGGAPYIHTTELMCARSIPGSKCGPPGLTWHINADGDNERCCSSS